MSGLHDLTEDIGRFIFVEDEPEKADVIFVCGSARLEPAGRAAELYLQGYSEKILPTGRFGERFESFRAEMSSLARNDGRDPEEVLGEIAEHAGRAGKLFPETEWEYQRNELIQRGVPEEDILREDRSVNTFENALFARRVLEAAGIRAGKAILCCQAFHARRALMTMKTEFTDTDILVCPAVTRGYSRDAWYGTPRGYDKIFDELQKCGEYFRGDRMYAAFRDGVPASECSSPAGGV